MLKNTWGYIRLNLIEIFKSFVEEISQKIKKSMLMRVCSVRPPSKKKYLHLKMYFLLKLVFWWFLSGSLWSAFLKFTLYPSRVTTNELYEAQTTNKQRSQYIHVFVFSIGVTGASCHNVIISKTISFWVKSWVRSLKLWFF